MTTSSRLARLLPTAASARPRPRLADDDVAEAVGGVVVEPGVVEVVGARPLSDGHGAIPLSALAGDVAFAGLGLPDVPATDLLFLDTETTGLAGGTGTLPFLLGLARVRDDAVQVRQLLLTGFGGEQRLLQRAASWVEPATHLVSYNGKSFDVPLLVTRHRLRSVWCRLPELAHVDLLHPTRTAFGRRWPDCRLATAEAELLHVTRHDDLPGAAVPEVWSALVRRGELRDLPRVLQHNRIDLLTLAVLLPALSAVFASPQDALVAQADPLAIARHHERRGDDASALAHLLAAEGRLDPDGLLALARLHRRAGDLERAVDLWQELAGQDVPSALEHLAKYHEHVRRDPSTALDYAARLDGAASEHRRRRLRHKVARAS
jgi:uncharacterized protein